MICKFRPTWRSICLQHDPQFGVLADKTGGLLATPARLYPRATPPGRTLGACHSAVSLPVLRRGRPSMVTATCRIFRRSQRPKDDAVGKWRSLYRRLSGPLRFPRYHVHPKRRQSLLATNEARRVDFGPTPKVSLRHSPTVQGDARGHGASPRPQKATVLQLYAAHGWRVYARIRT